jgi:hypothetical protein
MSSLASTAARQTGNLAVTSGTLHLVLNNEELSLCIFRYS